MSGALDESVTLLEVLSVVSTKRVPLAPELAGYLALEIAEQCAKEEFEVEPGSIYVSEEGSVAVVRKKAGSEGAEASIRALLGRLLEASGSQTPALAAAARRKPGAGVTSLAEDLEAALIPVNRAAGRRALARLAREVKRVVLGVGRNASVPASERRPQPSSPAEPPPEPPEPLTEPLAASPRPPPATTFDDEESPTTAKRDIPPEMLAEATNSKRPELQQPISLSDLPTVGLSREDLEAAAAGSRRDAVDSLLDKFEVSEPQEDKALSRDLKAMVGLEPTPPPPVAVIPDDGVDALLTDPSPAPKAEKKRDAKIATKSEGVRVKSVSYADDRQLPTSPSQIKKQQLSVSSEVGRKKSASNVIIVLALLMLVGGAVAVWMLKPGFFTGRTPEKIQQEKEETEKERQRVAALQAVPQCRTSLEVADAPDQAEILLRVGQAPADIEKMPAGLRLEFVATADGFAPRRAVIPAGGPWETGPNGKPRFELAIQLDKSKAKPGQVDPWPGVDPGNDVGTTSKQATLTPGTVHAISTPKGAEIWLVAGLGPSATVEDLAPCDTDLDLLVAGPKLFRKRMHVAGSQFQPDAARPGWKAAKISVGTK